MNGKYFEKLNIKTVISTLKCALESNLSQCGEH